MKVIFNTEPRRHLIWFVHGAYDVDPSKVREIFIDATYNTSRLQNHLYAIMAQELGYGIPLAFMLMEIHDNEETKSQKHEGEASQCNLNFYRAAKEFGVDPTFVHTDKDYAEISPAKVLVPECSNHGFKLEEFEMDGLLLVLLD
jgi:hypothetical protein